MSLCSLDHLQGKVIQLAVEHSQDALELFFSDGSSMRLYAGIDHANCSELERVYDPSDDEVQDSYAEEKLKKLLDFLTKDGPTARDKLMIVDTEVWSKEQ